MTKKIQTKSNLYDCLIVKSQQLNPLYNSSLIDFSLTLNYTTFMITIEDFKIIFPYVGVLPFTSVFQQMRTFVTFIMIHYTFFNSPICFSYICFITGYIRATTKIYYVMFKFSSITHCSFISILPVVLVCGSLVILVFSVSILFLIMFSTVVEG